MVVVEEEEEEGVQRRVGAEGGLAMMEELVRMGACRGAMSCVPDALSILWVGYSEQAPPIGGSGRAPAWLEEAAGTRAL